MLTMVLSYYNSAVKALSSGVYLGNILELPIRERIARAKYIDEKDVDKIDEIIDLIPKEIDKLVSAVKEEVLW